MNAKCADRFFCDMASILGADLKSLAAVFLHGNLCWRGGRFSWKGFRVLLIASHLFFCGLNGRATGIAPAAGEFCLVLFLVLSLFFFFLFLFFVFFLLF